MLNPQLPEFLSELEKAILSYLLKGDSEENRVLREQLKSSSLESREYTGCGFFTNFKTGDSAPLCERENFELGHVVASLAGQECGFVLFVRARRISFLEGYTFGVSEWPSSETVEYISKIQSC
jgi:hypothetical protein